MQNCKTVYVICKKCEEANTGSTTNEDHVTGSVPDYNQNNQSSLEQLIISKLQKIEYAIDRTITKKLAENYKSIEEKISTVNESYAESIKKSLPPSQGNHGQSFREIIREHQNEELVQQKERESRSRNFIIHGLHEPQNAESRGDEDHNTINEFLKVVQVEASVDSVIIR